MAIQGVSCFGNSPTRSWSNCRHVQPRDGTGSVLAPRRSADASRRAQERSSRDRIEPAHARPDKDPSWYTFPKGEVQMSEGSAGGFQGGVVARVEVRLARHPGGHVPQTAGVFEHRLGCRAYEHGGHEVQSLTPSVLHQVMTPCRCFADIFCSGQARKQSVPPDRRRATDGTH